MIARHEVDTIVALATARGKAGVSVIRLSGPRSWEVCRALAGAVPDERIASLRSLRNRAGEIIDTAVVLAFAKGRSFTGEESCEFQVHGSVAVVTAVLKACLDIDGVRAAEPGEFARRAFEAGRLDLLEVEALADLIEAETEAQRRQAMNVLQGTAKKLVLELRDSLVESLAMIEACLDFADEELPEDMATRISGPLSVAEKSLKEQLAGRDASERLRDGFEVAILGKVNAGKSSLLNALTGREVAITSARAGTTRDVIEVRLDLSGMPITLLDTAGFRETDDEIELLGIERGRKRSLEADLRIYLKSTPDEEPEGLVCDDIVVLSKADLWGKAGVSALTGEGLDALLNEIAQRLQTKFQKPALFSRERHFGALQRALRHIEETKRMLRHPYAWDQASEDLRLAVRCLDGMLGKIDVEELLGRIFSSFCIGK